jgi:hypothetical protein
MEVSRFQELVLTLDVSKPQGPELHLEVSGIHGLDSGHVYTTGALAAPGRVFTKEAFAAPGHCLYNRSLEICPLGDIRNFVH